MGAIQRVASAGNSGARIIAEADKEVKILVSSKDYLITQNTIVASVVKEPNSFMIHPDTSRFVNANGECWSNESLMANYGSFIGGWNYVNHVQEPEKSVGFLADCVLRRRYLDEKQNLFVYYVDILTATHRDHSDLVRKILLKEIQFLSMGCTSYVSQCSRCGAVMHEEEDSCEHMPNKGQYFFDKTGVRRKVAELLGSSEKGSVVFEEASWLTELPAFEAAINRNVMSFPENCDIEMTVPSQVLERPAMQKYIQGSK